MLKQYYKTKSSIEDHMLYTHYSYIEQNCVILELLYELPNMLLT